MPAAIQAPSPTSEHHLYQFGGLFIPFRLLTAPGMNILDKVLLTQIETLCSRQHDCEASDSYLAAGFGVNEGTISASISRLEKLGLVAVSRTSDGRRAIALTRAACDLWLPRLEATDGGL